MSSIIASKFLHLSVAAFALAGCAGTKESGSRAALQEAPQDPDNPPEFVAVKEPPVPDTRVDAKYPVEARKNHIEGVVWVKAVVSADGRVKRAVIMKSDNEILNDAAIRAIIQWTFRPAMMDGHPVAVWISIPFTFKLNK